MNRVHVLRSDPANLRARDPLTDPLLVNCACSLLYPADCEVRGEILEVRLVAQFFCREVYFALQRSEFGRRTQADPQDAWTAWIRKSADSLDDNLEGCIASGLPHEDALYGFKTRFWYVTQEFQREMNLAGWNPAYQIGAKACPEIGRRTLDGILQRIRELTCNECPH